MQEYPNSFAKQGEGLRGLEVIPESKEVGYYIVQKGNSQSAVPHSSYCPSCSSTDEYKYGKVQRKWSLDIADLEFKLSYKKDEKGLYASCDVCGFDLRDELFIEPEIKAEKPKAIEKEIMIQGAYFSEGFYWIDVEDFKKTMIKFREGVKVKLCIQQKIGPSVNILTMSHDAFKNASELSMKNHKIGIPRKFWKNN